MKVVFGRTNKEVPPLWFRLLGTDENGEIKGYLEKNCCVVDIGSSPGFWGHHLRGTQCEIMMKGGWEVRQGTNEAHASDLLNGSLVESLSILGRESVDYYFWQYQESLAEHQVQGTLRALEQAKEEGTIKHYGLSLEGSVTSALSMWRFHDAFECVLLERTPVQESNFQAFYSEAKKKRVGVVAQAVHEWIAESALTNKDQQTKSVLATWLAKSAQDSVVLVGVRDLDAINQCIQIVQDNFGVKVD